MPVREGGHHRRRVLDGEATRGAGGAGLHPDDVADQGEQVVHLVDEVEQDRAVAGLPAPAAAHVEVVVGFGEERSADHGHDRPEPTAAHVVVGRGHDG